jgi:DtxR family Mn-dependent transcriptional regulator
LGNPTTDPHGDPIPTKEGHVDLVYGIPLTMGEANRAYRLVRVLLQDQERLAYLGTLGLHPGAELTLRKVTPFHGPLVVETRGEDHALAYEMAEALIVAAT